MAIVFILAHVLVLLMHVNALNCLAKRKRAEVVGPMSKSPSGITTSSLFCSSVGDEKFTAGMELLTIKVPVQDDPGTYLPLITGTVSRERILKWYVSRIEAKMATIEVVVLSKE